MLLEVCAASVASAVAAEAGGAGRVELCDALVDGGTTPSVGMLQAVLEAVSIPVHVLIRPRPGDFCFSEDEVRVQELDVAAAKAAGAAGVVVGALRPDGAVDVPSLRRLIEAARPMSVTFHRAVDVCADPEEAVRVLAAEGVDRVLSSGAAPTALEGVGMLRRMVAAASGSSLVVMAGGGVTEETAAAIAEGSGVQELHGSARAPVESRMEYRPPVPIHMGGEKWNTPTSEFERRETSASRVEAIVGVLGAL